MPCNDYLRFEFDFLSFFSFFNIIPHQNSAFTTSVLPLIHLFFPGPCPILFFTSHFSIFLNPQSSSSFSSLLLSMTIGDDETDIKNEFNILNIVKNHFDLKDRAEMFLVSHNSKDGSRSVEFEVKGVKRLLGQTLSSTGLTM